MSLTGELKIECDYCEAYMGVVDTVPTNETTVFVGAQFCCPKCYQERGAAQVGLA